MFSAITCRTSLCFAVGTDGNGGPFVGGPFIEAWNGHDWTSSASPAGADGSLAGVSCATNHFCFAVGGRGRPQQTLVECWNGTHWSVVATPNPAGSSTLTGVSCVNAKNCFAVGSSVTTTSQQTLVERWDGTHWAILKSPNFRSVEGGESWLNAVSCISATRCFAVGSTEDNDDDTYILRWNGTTWAVSARQTGNGFQDWLQGVSCVSTTNCVAVGQESSDLPGMPLEDHWNGSAWTLEVGTQLINLQAVSCTTATNCLAVGSLNVDRPFAQKWDGTTWSPTVAPKSPAVASFLVSVTCMTATNCYGAGSNTVEQWNGSSWSIVAHASGPQ
ncbi:MAG: hypothetical protein ACLPVY_22730 [Acidimicrobiia bacterium]